MNAPARECRRSGENGVFVSCILRKIGKTTKVHRYEEYSRLTRLMAQATSIQRGGVMKLQFRKLPALIVATVFAITATTTMARTFRSADVHAKDYPTNLAVKY